MSKLKLTLPIVPSVNHVYRNVSVHRRILTKIGQNWRTHAQYIAKTEVRRQGWELPQIKQKIIMEIWTYWPDRRRRDTHNSHKLLADALEGIIYIDDQYLLIRDMDYAVDKKNPRVEMTIYLHEVDNMDKKLLQCCGNCKYLKMPDRRCNVLNKFVGNTYQDIQCSGYALKPSAESTHAK